MKGGATAGGTDGSGLCAVDEPIPIRDVHATLLDLLGLDDGHRTYPHAGRIRRWTDIRADVLKVIITSGVSAGSLGNHRGSERWPTRQEHGSAKSLFENLGEAAIRRVFGSGCVSWRRGPRSRRWRWRSRGRGRGGGGASTILPILSGLRSGTKSPLDLGRRTHVRQPRRPGQAGAAGGPRRPARGGGGGTVAGRLGTTDAAGFATSKKVIAPCQDLSCWMAWESCRGVSPEPQRVP